MEQKLADMESDVLFSYISNFFCLNSAMNRTILGEIFGNIPLYPRKVLKIVLFLERFSVLIFLGPEEKYGK